MDDETVVVPEQSSVQELRTWLAGLGQQHRQHYEKGRLLSVSKQATIRSRISKLEDSLGPLAESPTSHWTEGRSWESPPEPPTPPGSDRKEVRTSPPYPLPTTPPHRYVSILAPASWESPPSRLDTPVTVMTRVLDYDTSPSTDIPVPKDVSAVQDTPPPSQAPVAPTSEGTLSKATRFQSLSPAKLDGHRLTPKRETLPSQLYTFEAVRPSPRRLRVVELDRLLEPPLPRHHHRRTFSWDSDFSEPTFDSPRWHHHPVLPQTFHMQILGKEGTSEAGSTVWNSDWAPDGDDEDDQNSLVDASSVATGRYTDPGFLSRTVRHRLQHPHDKLEGSRKNRFPLWLCHKRPAEGDDPEDDPEEEERQQRTHEPKAFYHPSSSVSALCIKTDPVTVPNSVPSPPLSRPTPRMSRANFFPDGVLTKETLDILCASSKDVAADAVEFCPSSSNDGDDDEFAPAILPGAVPTNLQAVLAAADHSRPPSVSTAIHRWGGRRRGRTSVQERRRQLQQAMANARPVAHVKRIQWHVCPKTGLYKKTIVVEPKVN